MNKLLKLLVATSCFVCQSFAMQNQIVPRWDEAHWRQSYQEGFNANLQELNEVKERIQNVQKKRETAISACLVYKAKSGKSMVYWNETSDDHSINNNEYESSKTYRFSDLWYDPAKNIGICCAESEGGKSIVFRKEDYQFINCFKGKKLDQLIGLKELNDANQIKHEKAVKAMATKALEALAAQDPIVRCLEEECQKNLRNGGSFSIRFLSLSEQSSGERRIEKDPIDKGSKNPEEELEKQMDDKKDTSLTQNCSQHETSSENEKSLDNNKDIVEKSSVNDNALD